MKTSAPNTASTEPPSGSAAKSSKWKGQLLAVSGKSTATAIVLKATGTSVAQVDGRAERLRVTVTKELTPAEEQFEALKQKVKDITDLEDHIGTGKKFREAVKGWVKQARSQSKACGALVKRISATKSKTAFETEIGRLERICQACDCVAVLGDAIQSVDTSHDDFASAIRGSETNDVTLNITFHVFDLWTSISHLAAMQQYDAFLTCLLSSSPEMSKLQENIDKLQNPEQKLATSPMKIASAAMEKTIESMLKGMVGKDLAAKLKSPMGKAFSDLLTKVTQQKNTPHLLIGNYVEPAHVVLQLLAPGKLLVRDLLALLEHFFPTIMTDISEAVFSVDDSEVPLYKLMGQSNGRLIVQAAKDDLIARLAEIG